MNAEDIKVVAGNVRRVIAKLATADATLKAELYWSPAHRRSFNRRTSVERSFATVKDAAGIDLRRGSCRLLGRTPNLIMFSCAMVIPNLRTLASFARRVAADTERAAGKPPRVGRRGQSQPAN